MIGVDLAGGLGNQLFEYAYIYAQAKKLNTRFFLVKSGGPIEIYKYFELEKSFFYYIDRLFFNHQGFRLFFSHYLRGAFYNAIGKWFIDNNITVDNLDDPNKAVQAIEDKTHYHGYFQSEVYFEDHITGLLKVLSLKSQYTDAYAKKFTWLAKKAKVVVMHIRLTDFKTAFGYLNLGGEDLSLPLSYYHKVIRQIQHQDNYYVIISDDIELLKTEFIYLENKFFSDESEIMDFQLMMNADVCIIANSTFSWWAAYLNKRANKAVYCPQHFLGFKKGYDYPNKIYPQSWIKVLVN